MTEDIKEFHCCFCGHIFESIEDSGTHECPGMKKSNKEYAEWKKAKAGVN